MLYSQNIKYFGLPPREDLQLPSASKGRPWTENCLCAYGIYFECHEVYIVQTVPTFASDSRVSWQCHSTASHNNFRTPNSCTVILFTLIRSSGRQLRFSLMQHWQGRWPCRDWQCKSEGSLRLMSSPFKSNSNMIGNVWETHIFMISPFPTPLPVPTCSLNSCILQFI